MAVTDFPIENLPFGVCRKDGVPHICTALHDEVLDLHAAAARIGEPALLEPTLNAFAAKRNTAEVKQRIREVIDEIPRVKNAEMLLPFAIGDYTDFYAGIHHAVNVGRQFRPDQLRGPSFQCQNSFRRKISAADSAFHRGGPAGLRPISGNKEILDRCLLRRPPPVATGPWRKRRRAFSNHNGSGERCGF